MNRCRLVLAAALLLAGCSDSESSSPTTTTTTTASSVPLAGTATASLSFAGDAGLAGVAVRAGVRCNLPRLDGQSITVLAEASVPGTAFIIELRATRITVQAYSGSGADYHERKFEGTGVTGFDAAKGTQVDAPLTEVAPSSDRTAGTIGAITSITGSVQCGSQTPGTSTITITGDTAEGAFANAKLDPVKVECSGDAQGSEVFVSAIASIGSVKVEVGLGLASDGSVTLDLTGGRHFEAPGTTAITATGAHVTADVVEENASPAHTLHIEGDAVCGSPVSG